MSEKIAVLGGGLAGTAAAHTLVNRGYDVTIIEQRDRLGGRVHSELVDGAAVEMGAGFLTQGYTNLLGFIAATGLNRQLYQQHDGSSGILRDGQVHMVTPGALLGNKPLSWEAKLHSLPLLFKTFASWRQLNTHAFWEADKYDNRSVADMFSSSSGKEFLEYVLQPILNGYFYWTPEHTSEAMMRILCKAAFTHDAYKVKGGLQRIPEKAAEGSTVLLGRTVMQALPTAAGAYDIAVSHRGKKQMMRVDGVVCATTATAVPNIFSNLTERQRKFFEAIRYSSGTLIACTYRQEQTRGNKAVAFPRREKTDLSSITLSPEPGATNTTYAIIKTYASGSEAARLAKLSDQALTSVLTAAMAPAHDVVLIGTPKPVATHVQRWSEALPFFDVGHFKRLRQFENGEIEDSGQRITFAGDYIGGPFMEGAFTSGVRAAERLDARLRQ